MSYERVARLKVTDLIDITWPQSGTTESVEVVKIGRHSITVRYLDDNDREEIQFDEDGVLPFDWKPLSPTLQKLYNEARNANPTMNVHSDVNNAISPPGLPVQNNEIEEESEEFEEDNDEQFEESEESENEEEEEEYEDDDDDEEEYEEEDERKYDEEQKEEDDEVILIDNSKSAQNSKQSNGHYNDAYNNHNNNYYQNGNGNANRWVAKQQNNQSKSNYYEQQKESEYFDEYDRSLLPLKGDLLQISHRHGTKDDPVRVIHCDYLGSARVRYVDARGAENKVNLLRNNDISYSIADSVYDSVDDFVPAPRIGDTVEIRWTDGGGKDVVRILNVNVEYDENYQSTNQDYEYKQNEKVSKNVKHFDKFSSINVTFCYLNDREEESMDFHPNDPNSEILSWRTLICGNGVESPSMDLQQNDIENELCSVCCTPFGEFAYRTVVPCTHNNVCAKCTLRLRVFGEYGTQKNPYPICPFCKESWETVAFIPLSWSTAIRQKYGSNDAKYEWNCVFSHPLEYDDEIQCFFTDIHTLQKFIHIRSLYCLICHPPNIQIENFNKVYYYHSVGKLLYHLRTEHTSFACQLCLENATLFIDEQRLFLHDKRKLIDHERNGSPVEGKYGETAPHPFCSLCRRNFYSREALYEHCEDNHASCHLCKASGILEYYKNADILRQHHREMHHLCEHPMCLAKLQPVVFDDPVCLQSHQLQAHGWQKTVSSVRTAFKYGDDDKSYNQFNGTMNFNAMFSQSDIGYLNASRYGNQMNGDRQQNNNVQQQMSEEQMAMNRQRELHKRMDKIKQRWFPNSYQNEKKKKLQKLQADKLGLKNIPDAVPNDLKNEKHKSVIIKIRNTLISTFNFKQFQQISHSYKVGKSSSSVFFEEFKSLFCPLCAEDVWSDILIKMLALLDDGKKRIALYSEYRAWVLGGRVNKKKTAMSNKQKQKNAKPKRTNVRSAASIVSGQYKKPSKEMILSQRRAQKLQKKVGAKAQSKNLPKIKSPPIQTKGKWKNGNIAKKMNKKKVLKKAAPKKVIAKVVKSKPPQQKWPTLEPAKNVKKAPVKYVDDTETMKPPKAKNKKKQKTKQQNAKTKQTNIGNKAKKVKRGPRKSKSKQLKKEQQQKIAQHPAFEQENVASTPQQITSPKVIKMPEIGQMPHEVKQQNNAKQFNKSNPWGAAPNRPKKTNVSSIINKQQKNTNNQKKKNVKKNECEQKENKKQRRASKRNDDCYFDRYHDAQSELQGAYVRLCHLKQSLFSKDKIALFLLFLFESFYPNFELNFAKEMEPSSFELSKKYRQHIYQSVYDLFWKKCPKKDAMTIDHANKKIKCKVSAFKLRPGDNVMSWKFLRSLPGLNEHNVTQIGALHSMLGGIDDNDLDMAPLKPWMAMMDFSLNEIYCILLYLWFILDVELPAPPYPFIGANKDKKNKNVPKKNVASSQNQSIKKIEPKQQKQQKKKQKESPTKQRAKKKNKQKARPVSLGDFFKMDGM